MNTSHHPGLLALWPSDAFSSSLKAALESLPIDHWPLSAGGGIAIAAQPITVTILNTRATPTGVEAEIGLFYEEILAGCACGDEPQTAPAYQTLRITLAFSDGTLNLLPST